MRQTPFERDFADLHGRRPRAAEFIRHEDVQNGRIVKRADQPGLRLTMGALGLFWAVVLCAVLVAMVVVAVAMVAGLFDPARLGP